MNIILILKHILILLVTALVESTYSRKFNNSSELLFIFGDFFQQNKLISIWTIINFYIIFFWTIISSRIFEFFGFLWCKIVIIVLIYYYFLEISYNRTGLLGSELLLILLFFYNWTIILNRTIILFLGLRYFSLYSVFESPEMIQKGRRKYYRFE